MYYSDYRSEYNRTFRLLWSWHSSLPTKHRAGRRDIRSYLTDIASVCSHQLHRHENQHSTVDCWLLKAVATVSAIVRYIDSSNMCNDSRHRELSQVCKQALVHTVVFATTNRSNGSIVIVWIEPDIWVCDIWCTHRIAKEHKLIGVKQCTDAFQL
jgi:hypothetical protein